MLSNHNKDKAFLLTGFCNWKKTTLRFEEHANSKCHGEAVERLFTLPKVLKDVGKSLSKQHSEQKKGNRFLEYMEEFKISSTTEYSNQR